MHIQQIEIDNFKSFAEKTVIPFKEGFTTISGPNGSGKSNIIDSILFCLGLSSSRTMRAEKLSDLINNLSKRREALVTISFRKDNGQSADGRPRQMEMTLVPDEIDVREVTDADESTGQTADAPNPEGLITVTRRIKDGAGGYTSTYYLNGKVSTLSEIHDTLSQFNISPGCYNVMMQGDVSGIVNMSPMERRKIIDEIAGVAEFDRKIEQAQRELEATGANIERNTILLGEIEARMEQLSTERDQALRYQKLRDERQVFEAKLLASRFLDIRKSIQSTQQNIANARLQKEAKQAEIQKLAEEIQLTHAELQRLSLEVKRKGEDQQIALKKHIEGLKGHISRKRDSINAFERQIADNAKAVQRMEKDILRHQENIEGIEARIQGFQHQLEELQGLYNNEAKSHDALNKKYEALGDSNEELNHKRMEVRRKLEAERDELSRLNREKLDLEAQESRQRTERERRIQEQSGVEGKRQTLTERQTVLSKQVRDLELEKAAFEAQLNQIQMDYSKARVSLNNAQTEFTNLSREHMRLEAQKRAYDDVNFGRAVDTVLNAGLDGVHGTLSQLGTVDPNYSLALETAIGGRIQNIVVDDDRVAQAGIELLQRTRAGRATFLPLNKIQQARNLPYLPNDPGVVDYAYNLIDFDPLYTDIFAYALGDTLIVEDMAAARKLLRKYRMVTLDGSLLEKSGAMSGGSQQGHQKAGGKFANSNKVDQEIRELQTRIDEAESLKERMQKHLNALELKKDSVQGEYAKCHNAHARATLELESVENQMRELEATSAPIADVETFEKKLAELAAALAEVSKLIAAREAVIETLASELQDIESQFPADKLEEIRKEISEVKFQMDYYQTQINNVQLEMQTKNLDKTYQEQGMKSFRERIVETGKQSEEFAREKAAHLEEIQLTQLQINELESQTTELDEELKKLQEERDAVQAKLIEQEKGKHIQQRQTEQLDEQILSFQARKRELEPKLAQVQWEMREAKIDPASIEEGNLPSEDEVNRSIQRLTRQMEALEPVNMLAIKEYDEVEGRKKELGEKIETLSRERETLTVKIGNYQELKLLSFRKAFDNVDNHFKTIFAELSDGIGQLVLTNPEDPFNGGLTIHAQPRGKKMQRLESMSGGEKSLTSLAFVFSLQRYMPAPFYALDEVDMNLDGINAEKLAHMVKRESEAAQFIVVSLRKPMIENSDRTVGVTQKRDGISKVTGVKLRADEPPIDVPREAAS